MELNPSIVIEDKDDASEASVFHVVVPVFTTNDIPVYTMYHTYSTFDAAIDKVNEITGNEDED